MNFTALACFRLAPDSLTAAADWDGKRTVAIVPGGTVTRKMNSRPLRFQSLVTLPIPELESARVHNVADGCRRDAGEV